MSVTFSVYYMSASTAYFLATSYSRSNCYHFSVLLLPFLSLCHCLFSIYQYATFCLSVCFLFIHLLPLFSSFTSYFFSVPLAFKVCFSSFHVRLMRLCYQACKSCLTDRVMTVRVAAAGCLLEMLNHAPFLYTSGITIFLIFSICSELKTS